MAVIVPLGLLLIRGHGERICMAASPLGITFSLGCCRSMRVHSVQAALHTGYKRGHLPNTPDWVRRSIRLSLCLIIFGLLGHTVHYPGVWASEVSKSFNWAAITCIVVTAPLIGKASETANYRIVGTISGGLWGFAMWWLGAAMFGISHSGTFVALVSPILVVGTTWLAYKKGMDQLAKYMQITYVICGYGTFLTAADAITLTMIRVSGIISGAVLSLLLAVLILPRTASKETCRDIKKLLKLIVDLNEVIWKLYDIAPAGPAVMKIRRGHHYESVHKISLAFSSTGQLDRKSVELDKVATDVNDLNANEATAEKIFVKSALMMSNVDSMIEATKAEIYIHHLWGWYFFLPGFLFFPLGSWHLPEKEVTGLLCAIRRIFRLQWALFKNMEEGMGDNLRTVLKASYPKAMLTELSKAMKESLEDLQKAFPNGDRIEVDNFLNLGTMIDALIHISDAKMREALSAKRVMRQERRTQAGGGGRASAEFRKVEKAKSSDEVILEVSDPQDNESANLIPSNGQSDQAPQEATQQGITSKGSLMLETAWSLEEVLAGGPTINHPILPKQTVQFPDTHEGFYATQQFHSFMHTLDELFEEIEDAYVACSDVMSRLPYPIT